MIPLSEKSILKLDKAYFYVTRPILIHSSSTTNKEWTRQLPSDILKKKKNQLWLLTREHHRRFDCHVRRPRTWSENQKSRLFHARMMALNISISWYRFCTTPRQQQPPQKGKIKIKTKAKARKLREKIRKIEKKIRRRRGRSLEISRV